jgi:hypothetical protein
MYIVCPCKETLVDGKPSLDIVKGCPLHDLPSSTLTTTSTPSTIRVDGTYWNQVRKVGEILKIEVEAKAKWNKDYENALIWGSKYSTPPSYKHIVGIDPYKEDSDSDKAVVTTWKRVSPEEYEKIKKGEIVAEYKGRGYYQIKE